MSLHITKTEKWNRIIWTILAAGLPFLSFLFYFVLFLLFCFQQNQIGMVLMGILSAISIIPPWTIWHCVYKKHGTRLLTFLIFFLPGLSVACVTATTFAPSLFNTYIESHSTTLSWATLISVTYLLCSVLMGLQLRKTNKKLYLQKHSTEDYERALEQMKFSTSMEDLEIQFRNLIEQWPKLERHTSQEYKKHSKHIAERILHEDSYDQ